MKIGLLMVITAVSLFTGTVVWSTVKPVERKRYDGERLRNFPAPDRMTDHSWFFHSENTLSFIVNAPVMVEIDESFTGVELRGDTSVFKYLQIWVNNNHLVSGSINITRQLYRSEALRDSSTEAVIRQAVKSESDYKEIMKSADITIRLGIGSGKDAGTQKRQLVLHGCKKVITLSPVTGQSLSIESTTADSLMMALDVRYLDVYNGLDQPGERKYVRLNGKAERVHYKISNTELDAHALITAESYLNLNNKSSMHVFATEILNVHKMKECNLNISGDPKYKRISER